MRRRFVAVAFGVACLAAGATAAHGQLYVAQPSTYLNYGYGNSSWTTFTSYINGAFGGSGNVSVFNSTGQSTIGFSAMLIDLGGTGATLTSADAVNIANFIASDRRLLFVGENNNWAAWNQSFLNIVGGTFDRDGLSVGRTREANSLTSGVGMINAPAPGSMSGGTSLFSNNAVNLFGPNTLAMLDVNMCDDAFIGSVDNSQFCQNTAAWLSESGTGSEGTGLERTDPEGPGPVDVPEPSTAALLLSGLFGLGFMFHRRREE